MDTEKAKKELSQRLHLSSLLGKKALGEMRIHGKVLTVCSKCEETLTITTSGRYEERRRVRCKCGYISMTEYGI